MTMNEHTVKGKWLEIKGEIQKAWGNLTDNELEKTKGDMKAIGGLIQQRYGEAQDHSQKKLSEIFQKFENRKDIAVEKVRENLK